MGVRIRVGEPGAVRDDVAVGVLVDSTVVAFLIDQEADFRPAEVEAVIATLPFEPDGTAERIPATQIDILVPQGTAGVRAVAFATLAHGCAQIPDLPETSQNQLAAVIRETGDLWSAVVSGTGTESPAALPDHVVRQVEDDESPHPWPPVQTHLAASVEQHAFDWCSITPRCVPPVD